MLFLHKSNFWNSYIHFVKAVLMTSQDLQCFCGETRKNILQMSLVVRKPAFCICENKDADQLRGNREADQRLCFFATRIVQSLYFLNTKFQASSHLLWLYSLVCIGPGQKTRRPVFSQRDSNINLYPSNII